jgi:NAD(P)H-dependent FMN reductase
MTKVLIVPGSARRESLNKKLAKIAQQCAKEAGMEPTYVDLADFPMPMYDGDVEEKNGVPPYAKALREVMKEHPAWVFVAPEYNGSVTPLLKNGIDWTSRPDGDEKNLAAFKGKTAALLSASPGALGGMRGLTQLRHTLHVVKVLTIPEDFSLVKAHEAFDEKGELKDPKQREKVLAVMQRLAAVAK